MASAVIGFGCLIKHVKIQRKKIWKKGLVRKNVIHSFSKTKLQLSYIYIYIYIFFHYWQIVKRRGITSLCVQSK